MAKTFTSKYYSDVNKSKTPEDLDYALFTKLPELPKSDDR